MGTQTLGSTAAGVSAKDIWWTSSTGAGVKAHGNYNTAPEDIYVDGVYVYAWRNSSGSSTFRYALYGTGGSKLGETTSNPSVGSSPAWGHGSWPAGSYLFIASGSQFYGAVIDPTSGGIETYGYNDNGDIDFVQGTTTLANPWSGSGTKTAWGSLPWYITYFPKATITGFKDPNSNVVTYGYIGEVLEIDGQSFTAGVTGIDFNGVAADLGTLTVVSDTKLTITIPTGATTGPVHVATNAGTATSSTFTIAGGRVYHSGALKETTALRVYHGGSLKNVIAIRAYHNGALHDVE